VLEVSLFAQVNLWAMGCWSTKPKLSEPIVAAVDPTPIGLLGGRVVDSDVSKSTAVQEASPFEAYDMGSLPDIVAKALLVHKAAQDGYTQIKPGDVVVLLTTGAQGQVLQRTTTDVLLMMRDGNESWHEIEDIQQESLILTNAEVGDQVVLRGTGARAKVLQQTTTDILLKMTDGEEIWHEVEDVRQDFSVLVGSMIDKRVGHFGDADGEGRGVILVGPENESNAETAMARLPSPPSERLNGNSAWWCCSVNRPM